MELFTLPIRNAGMSNLPTTPQRGYFKVYRICPYTGKTTLWKTYSRRGELPTLKSHVESTYTLGTYTELTVYPTGDNIPQVWVLNRSYATYGHEVVWKMLPRR